MNEHLAIREILLPTLRAAGILVMDNLSAHKDREALDLLKDAGVSFDACAGEWITAMENMIAAM